MKVPLFPDLPPKEIILRTKFGKFIGTSGKHQQWTHAN